MDWLALFMPLIRDIALPIATTIGVGFAASYLKNKTGIELSDSQKKLATQVIQAVEEKAFAAAKTGAAPTGTQKNALAVTQYATLTGATPAQAQTAIDLAVGSHPTIGAFTVSSKIPPEIKQGG